MFSIVSNANFPAIYRIYISTLNVFWKRTPSECASKKHLGLHTGVQWQEWRSSFVYEHQWCLSSYL